MQKLATKQQLSTRFTPQQIQYMHLLQLSHTDLERRIKKEIEENPTLEQAETTPSPWENKNNPPPYIPEKKGDIPLADMDRVTTPTSWREELEEQALLLNLTAKEQETLLYLIGALTPNGYLDLPLDIIAAERSLMETTPTTPQEVAQALARLQQFDPPGIGARNLQESLQLQLQRKTPSPEVQHALTLIKVHFPLFSKRQYSTLQQKMKLSDAAFQKTLTLIRSLNPEPITQESFASHSQRLDPDFFIKKDKNTFLIQSPKTTASGLRIHDTYQKLLKTYKKAQEKQHQATISFIEGNIQKAKWFIQAIEQRHRTLLRIVDALLTFQRPFFLEEKNHNLRPLTLRQIAEHVQMDISTISRAIKDKSLKTTHHIYPLKFFFSEAIPTKEGTPVSSRAIKTELKALIQNENPSQPHTDEALAQYLQKKGVFIARRTIAKYREQLQIPPSHLRKHH